ncbi:Helicase POLQ-like [Frankliniella fusca]|uniref:Helicase POLQ-like n=1 Tax=Frankliniella fusca TaxID=407009 RepID=A0AAE1I3E3_9NEOP|nr:Helicase POLQ-like [Frankliniella fusca]
MSSESSDDEDFAFLFRRKIPLVVRQDNECSRQSPDEEMVTGSFIKVKEEDTVPHQAALDFFFGCSDDDFLRAIPSPSISQASTGSHEIPKSPAQHMTCHEKESTFSPEINGSFQVLQGETLPSSDNLMNVHLQNKSPDSVVISSPLAIPLSKSPRKKRVIVHDAAGGLDEPQNLTSRADEGSMATCNVLTSSSVLQGACTSSSPEVKVEDTEERFMAMCGEEQQFLDPRALNRPPLKPSAEIISVDDNDFYGMGQDVKDAVLSTFSVKKLHLWQHEMLIRHLFTEKGEKNALVLSPTSSGKTLIAVIMALQTMIISKKDSILALPYVAIVAEKVRELKILSTKLKSVSVAEYAGQKGHFPPPKQRETLRTLYVATTEKASGICKFLCKDSDRRQEIGLVIFDEFHMLADGARGIVIEDLVVSLLHRSQGKTKILALSATIGNPYDVQKFLVCGSTDGCIYNQVNMRPIEIQENVVVGGSVLPISRKESQHAGIDYTTTPRKILEDGDKLLDQNLATDLIKRQREFLAGHLKQESKGMVDEVLLRGIGCGFAYHSAALSTVERVAIEDAYVKGIITTIFCTSTLAA